MCFSLACSQHRRGSGRNLRSVRPVPPQPRSSSINAAFVSLGKRALRKVGSGRNSYAAVCKAGRGAGSWKVSHSNIEARRKGLEQEIVPSRWAIKINAPHTSINFPGDALQRNYALNCDLCDAHKCFDVSGETS